MSGRGWMAELIEGLFDFGRVVKTVLGSANKTVSVEVEGNLED